MSANFKIRAKKDVELGSETDSIAFIEGNLYEASIVETENALYATNERGIKHRISVSREFQDEEWFIENFEVVAIIN